MLAMKLPFALSLLFLLLMFGKEIDAIRKGQEEYWKTVMGDEQMPESIKGLLFDKVKEEEILSENPFEPKAEAEGERLLRTHFKKDFDVSAVNAIIYHPHVEKPQNDLGFRV